MSDNLFKCLALISIRHREPEYAATHWTKSQKLIDADETFSDTAKYLRRFTKGIKPFAQFVSGPS